ALCPPCYAWRLPDDPQNASCRLRCRGKRAHHDRHSPSIDTLPSDLWRTTTVELSMVAHSSPCRRGSMALPDSIPIANRVGRAACAKLQMERRFAALSHVLTRLQTARN